MWTKTKPQAFTFILENITRIRNKILENRIVARDTNNN